MIHVNIITEGQTEETFVRDVLAPHLRRRGVRAKARCIETGRRRNHVFRGGLIRYWKARNEIFTWGRQDPGAWITTMFDLYALPDDFPGFDEALAIKDPYRKVAFLEEAFERDVRHPRFIPYFSLHEFEALLFSDVPKMGVYFLQRDRAISALEAVAEQFPGPEYINGGERTAPSKRLGREIPSYLDSKSSAGPIIAAAIGLPKMRERCPHFDAWVGRLESLASLNRAAEHEDEPGDGPRQDHF